METAVIVGFIFMAILATSVSFQISGGTVGGGTAPPLPGFPDNNPGPGSWNLGANSITNDPSTWPSSDRIWMVCCAIASAEGAATLGSVPDRLNNPGDISDGSSIYPGESHSGSIVTHFPDKGTGWQWLYKKVQNIQNRNSQVYSPDMSWTQIAQKWAGNWQSWEDNVCAFLGVSPDSKFSDYTG